MLKYHPPPQILLLSAAQAVAQLLSLPFWAMLERELPH
jgi:hypothetical protein